MALVKCPDCGHDVSSRAEACPYCGCPCKHFPKRVQLGGTCTLGRWCGEAIEWRVLAVEGNRALLITDMAVACRQFHHRYSSITWEQCDLRRWLNGEFYHEAFDANERTAIAESLLRNDGNSRYGTPGGPNTCDFVFCLSFDEVQKYFGSDGERICYPTACARINGVECAGNGACFWWLRSPGNHAFKAAFVFHTGDYWMSGVSVNAGGCGVRPALWLNQ